MHQQIFADTVENDHRIVDGESDECQQCRHDVLIDFEIQVGRCAVEQYYHAERNQNVVEQRDDAGNAVDKLKAESNVHHDDRQRRNDGIDGIFPKFCADLRSDFVSFKNDERIIRQFLF